MSNRFLDIFVASPFKSIKEHMSKVLMCVDHLKPMMQSVLAQCWNEAALDHAKIVALEREADDLKMQIRLHLPNTLFMPVSRFDLLELLSVQDKIANQAKDIANLMLERQMVFPANVTKPFQALLERCVDACVHAKLSVDKLDELVETGFRGHEAELVERMTHELDEIEQETDRLQGQVRMLLFSVEKEHSPIDVIFLYKMFDLTARLGNRAQRVGHRLQLLLAH